MRKFPTFRETFPDKSAFDAWAANFGLTIDDPDIFSHLFIKYGGDKFMYSSESIAASKIMQVLFVEYPAYIQRKGSLDEIYQLELEEYRKGTLSINNQAANPNTEPATDTLDPLPYINTQLVAGVKLSQFEALQRKYRAAYTSYLDQFLEKFEHLFFKIIAESEDVILYD